MARRPLSVRPSVNFSLKRLLLCNCLANFDESLNGRSLGKPLSDCSNVADPPTNMAAVTKNSPNLKKSSSQELLRRFIPNFIFKVLDERSTKFVQIKPLGALMAELQGGNLEHVLTYRFLKKTFYP